MEKLFMSAGIITTIVLVIVGIIKLPFDKFKKNHPQAYKSTFTGISFVLAIILSILDELYIMSGSLISVEFAILLSAVIAGVMGGYTAYEGLGLKPLIKKLITSIKQAKELATDKKVVKYLNKINDIDKAISILLERKKVPQEEIKNDIK